MECIGGSGVMETSMMPRLYREAPVNAIWEGSGNVQCLDVLRALHKSPETRDALLQEIGRAAGGHPALDAHLEALGRDLAEATIVPGRARAVVAGLALAWQASLLVRAGNAAVSDAFCAARLGGEGSAHHGLYGALPAGIDCRALMERAWPQIGVE
jgi:putative acyl-CoA dehydrogenase